MSVFLEKEEWLGLVTFMVIQYLGPYVPVNRDEYKRGSAMFKGAPPGWLFGPAWLVLKFLRGVAGFLYWNEGPATIGTAYHVTLAIYALNLILDVQWMPLFFGVKSAGVSFGVIVAIWATTLALVILSAIGGLWVSFAFFLVYLAWITYATYLNGQWFFRRIWNKLKKEDKETQENRVMPTDSAIGMRLPSSREYH